MKKLIPVFDFFRSIFPLQKKHQHFFWGFSAFMLFLILFFISSLSSLRAFLPYYFEISGFPFGSRNYLVVFQNNHELRPAGGFISAYALVKYNHSLFPDIQIHDVYEQKLEEHDYIKPPYPMEQLLGSDWYKGYSFRDANFYPDYPKTAEELMKMYNITNSEIQIDGVIAINYSFFENLITTLSPLHVEEKIFSKNNLFETLEFEVNNIDRHNVQALQKRKDIIKPLSSAIIHKILLNPFLIRKVSDTVVQSLASKDIQMYFKNPSLQKLIQNQGWGNSWPKDWKGDFLAVNEANLGGMKSDRYIQREVRYHVTQKRINGTQEEYELIGEVTIDIHHFGIENIPLSGDYKGFFRVYVPKGSTLIGVASPYEKELWSSDENSWHVFGNIVRLKPGESTRLSYRYELPNHIFKNNSYNIYIPKQSGTNEDYYTVIFEAPQGKRIESSTFLPKENFGVYQAEIYSDTPLDLKVLPDKTPPLIIDQKMANLQIIYLYFNEPVDHKNAINLNNYEIKDLNITFPKITDKPRVYQVEHSDRTVKLFVRGIVSQPEEFYQLTLKNISDTAGNVLHENQQTVTVPQRF